MIIKAKLKDLILLSSQSDEQEWIKKYTEMLKDDKNAEITIRTELEKPIFVSEYQEKRVTAKIYIKQLQVVGDVKHE